MGQLILRTVLSFCAYVVILGAPAIAQVGTGTAYPAKPIRLVVPFPAGGGTDVIARAVGEKMGQDLGQAIVVDNKPGAGGLIGGDAAARAPADGYTLLVGTNSTLVTSRFMNAKMPYDPDQFDQIGLIGITPLVMLINPSVPAKNVAELVAYAKANPGKVTYASFGTGTTSHLAAELFNQRAGVDMLHVPFKGAAEALPAIIGGQVAVYIDTIVSAMPHVKSGKLLALAVTTPKRAVALPNVPTIAEQGYPGYEMYPWYGIVARKGMPKEVTEKLRDVVARALRDPQLLSKLSATGAEATPMSAEEFSRVVREETTRTEKLVKDAKISPQ